MSKNARDNALKYHALNDKLFKETFTEILKKVRSSPIIKFKKISDEDLPKISVVTLTHNRPDFFKLAIYNFNTINYPSDKLEWIIYDTSNDEMVVENQLPSLSDREKLNIKYIKNNSIISIGKSRNLACKQASNDIIVFMDDDDYYPPNSVTNRVKALLNSNKNIVGCCILGSFDINKFISFIESKSFDKKLGLKISPATLCFKKEILDNNLFDDENIDEAFTLINNNYNNFKEISWEDIIVSLIHKNNTTYRNVPQIKANGCHYKWSEKLFRFLTSFDLSEEELKEQKDPKKSKESKEIK